MYLDLMIGVKRVLITVRLSHIFCDKEDILKKTVKKETCKIHVLDFDLYSFSFFPII